MPKKHAMFFRLLSARSRVSILKLLQERGEMSVDVLAKELGLSLPTVSRHLQLMRVQDLVGFRQEGQNRFYAVNTKEIADRISSFLNDVQIKLPS